MKKIALFFILVVSLSCKNVNKESKLAEVTENEFELVKSFNEEDVERWSKTSIDLKLDNKTYFNDRLIWFLGLQLSSLRFCALILSQLTMHTARNFENPLATIEDINDVGINVV